LDFKELLLSAFEALTINKLRTFLATLGIMIGIAAVIALISLGQASQQAVQNQIQSLGSNLLTVNPGAQQTGAVRGSGGSSTTLTYDDAKAILTSSNITTVSNVSPEYSGRGQAVAGKNNTNTRVTGVTGAYAEVRKVSVATGTFISDRDVESMSKVAVLGPQVVTDLFGDGATPIGQNVRINGVVFRVVGVTASKGGTGFANQDDVIYVPLLTAQKLLFGADHVTSVTVEAKSAEVMTQAQDQIGYLLLQRHRLTDPTQADFSIFSQTDILNTVSQVTGTFTSLLSGIAAISLLVGGIGIMNIMLVTVTERTREIGLRKALGAKKKTIIIQFLTEAIILTAIGGFFGMIIGILISYIISSLINMPFVLSFSSMFLAVGVSGVIGVLFGWYPARLAANLQPIEALRYE
jgi:putative ABC transport system permease protein